MEGQEEGRGGKRGSEKESEGKGGRGGKGKEGEESASPFLISGSAPVASVNRCL